MPLLKKIIKKWVLFILFGCGINHISAQTNVYNFEKLTTADGLSNNHITSILQDRDGFYWIGTVDGLNRFDGSSFRIFRNNKRDSASLINNYCSYLLEDDNGDIWVGTYNGISVFRKKKEKFENYSVELPGIDKSIINRISGIAKDKNGNIWISCYYVWKFNPGMNKFEQMPKTNYVSSYDLFSFTSELIYDSLLNGLWFIDGKTINFFDIDKNELYNYHNNKKHFALFERQRRSPLALDKDQLLWFYDDSTAKLYAFDITKNKILETITNNLGSVRRLKTGTKGKLWVSFLNGHSIVYEVKKSKTDNEASKLLYPHFSHSDHFTTLFADSDSTLWFGSKNGINILKKEHQYYEVYTLQEKINTASGAPFRISAIAKKSDSILFIGTNAGLFYYNLRQRKYRKLKIPGLSGVRCLYYSVYNKQLWIGGTDKIILYDAQELRFLKTLQLISYPGFFIAGKNEIWVGTWLNGLYRLDKKGKIIGHYSDEDPSRFIKTSSLINGNILGGEVWVGLNGGNGFAKYDTSVSAFKFYEIKKGTEVFSIVGTVTSITADHKNNLWIGSHGGGLYYWDRIKNIYTQYMQSDGLRSNFIYNIVAGSNGDLWISHANGVDYFLSSRQKFIPLEFDLPFPDTDYRNSAYAAEDGSLFFFNANTIIQIKARLVNNYTKDPKLVISSFRIFDKEIPYEKFRNGINLTYRENFLTIEFSKLRTNPSENVQYAYILEGFDKGWNYPGTRNFASYTNVSGGKYLFRLKAMNETGDWSDKELVVQLNITPPFWRTWWFLLLSVLLIAGTVFVYTKRRIIQVKNRQLSQMNLIVDTQEKEKKSISAQLHDDLGVRLSALKYFVISLRKYLTTSDKTAEQIYEKTILTIDESVEDIRYLLINLSPKTLNEYGYLSAVEDLVNKLHKLHVINVELSQYGLEQRLSNDIESGLYRITQELINNTLKHAQAQNICLNIEKIDDEIRLKYSDDGKGFELSNGVKGYGIDNIHTRVAVLNGRIEWETTNGRITGAMINIPHTKV